MRRYLLMIALGTIMASSIATSQQGNDESTNDRLKAVETDINKMKSTHISGYVQAEWQQFDQTTSVGGRALLSDSRRNFFTIRRGRLKVQHAFADRMSATIQTDFTERGVAIKDVFLTVNLLAGDRNSALSFNIGAFNRPNYEVETSSSSRESPERAQITRAFYPEERDLGLMLTARHTFTDNAVPMFELGVFNGTGLAAETDSYKDIIARLTFPLPLDRDGPVHVTLGGSLYYGGIPQLTDSIRVSESGVTRMVANDDLGGGAPGMGNRRNVNMEAQITLDLFSFGSTIIRGEFMAGRRPVAAVASVARDTVRFIPATTGSPFQIRNQSGFYAYLVQNLSPTWQVAVKADGFDRNTDLSGTQVTSPSDAASMVLGFGVNWFIDKMRITLWYEIPTFASDENIQRTGSSVIDTLRTEDAKDNKATIRFQYKF